MPTEYFFNLPQEKRDTIIKTAIKELSKKPLELLPQERILNMENMTEEEFSLCFENIDELLQYIMHIFSQKIEASISEELVNNEGDIFSAFHSALKGVIKSSSQDNNYAFYMNMLSHLNLNKGFKGEIISIEKNKLLEVLTDNIKLDEFKLQWKEDLVEVFEILIVLLRNSVTQVFIDSTDKEYILNSFEKELNMLKYGILRDRRVN